MQEFCSSHQTSEACAQSEVNLIVPPPEDVTCVHKVYDLVIPEDMLDADAVKVVRRLDRFGHEAYFVGGSIRDILLGIRPKDFDIATSALPGEVKREFRNCRLIGRRFRLAHLLFKDNKIVEVATFRRSATSEDDVSFRHAAENLFGGPADDAIRRDFTINALMYDVARHRIHDYVGGMADIEARLLNTIGDPARRFQEDPVRIIRAVKFALRLELTMHPKVKEAALQFAPLVAQCAPARLVEELYKIFRTAKSARCFEEMEKLGVLKVLMPRLSELAAQDPDRAWHYMEKADRLIKEGRQLSESVVLAAVVYPFASHILEEKGDAATKIHALFQEITHPIPFPKRCAAAVRQIINAQKRLTGGPHRAKAKRILEREYALEAIDFMEIIAEDETAEHQVSEWARLVGKQRGQKTERAPKSPRKHRPRRRKSRRESTNEDTRLSMSVPELPLPVSE
jgi:poly(A) polymerase